MNFSTIDLEWEIETAKVLCASFWNESHQEIFDNEIQLINFIFEKCIAKTNIIFSHYGGGSDFLFLLRYLVGKPGVYFNEREFFQVSSKIITFSVYYHGKKYQFRDSYALLFDSLENIAESFLGEKKSEDQKKLGILDQKRLREYCLNDSRLLYESIKFFMNDLRLDDLKFTYSSQAFADLEKRCNLEKLTIQTKDEYEYFRNWFFGGHVDVYCRYASPVFQYDIKSSYSYAQVKYGCPVGKFKSVKKFNSKNAGLYIIKCKTNLENPFFPYKCDNKTYWVNTNNSICVTDIKLRKLIELRIDFKIIKGYEWELDGDFFKPFVNYWFNYRKKGKAQKRIAKYFLNGGGFGKFSINRERECIKFGSDVDYYLTPDFNIGVKKEWKDFDYSQVHIGSRILEGGHINLFELQEKIGYDNLCYSDTDSGFSKREIRVENSGELGSYELEGKFDRGYFLGNKFYGCGNDDNFKTVLKGFPEKFSEQSYKQALFENKLNFKYAKTHLLKFRSALRRASDFVKVETFLREIKHIEIKRKILKDGINTQSYLLKGNNLI